MCTPERDVIKANIEKPPTFLSPLKRLNRSAQHLGGLAQI